MLDEKLEDRNALFKKLAKGAAQKLVTEDRIAGKMSSKLCEEMPLMMSESGIEATANKVYKCGSFATIRLEITGVDVDMLFATKAQEQNPDKAKKVQKLQGVAAKLGLKDKLNETLEKQIIKKMQTKLQEMLPEKMTEKMTEKGMSVKVWCNDPASQPDFFYEAIADLGLAGSWQAGSTATESGSGGCACTVM